MTLEDEFERACLEAVAECQRLGYPPNAWVAMIRRHGAAEAARQLLLSGDVQEGFHRLVRLGRLDLTVEFAVLNPYWSRLFDTRYREAAHWRLGQAMRGQPITAPTHV